MYLFFFFPFLYICFLLLCVTYVNIAINMWYVYSLSGNAHANTLHDFQNGIQHRILKKLLQIKAKFKGFRGGAGKGGHQKELLAFVLFRPPQKLQKCMTEMPMRMPRTETKAEAAKSKCMKCFHKIRANISLALSLCVWVSHMWHACMCVCAWVCVCVCT